MRAVRVVLGLFGVGLLLVGAVLLAIGQPLLALNPILAGLVALAIAYFEQTRYRARQGQTDATAAGLRSTDEVFVDPTTGQKTRVWVDPASGEREYRPDA